MEALVFALCLRVPGPAMTDRNAQADQPGGEGRMAALRTGSSPRRAVVAQDTLRHSMLSEAVRQRLLNRVRPLVGAGREHETEARVIVEHRQRMTALTAKQPKMAFEVHLPHRVR